MVVGIALQPFLIAFLDNIGGAYIWQSVKSAVRVLLSVSKSATLTEDPTEHGRLM